jgi:hypothetical protein
MPKFVNSVESFNAVFTENLNSLMERREWEEEPYYETGLSDFLCQQINTQTEFTFASIQSFGQFH